MKAVVTGGAGFIGSALIRHLIAQGADSVTAFDNLNSGHRKNLEGLGTQVAMVEGDIRDYEALASTFRGADLVVCFRRSCRRSGGTGRVLHPAA